MQIYYYCNYKGSPVGFNLGQFDISDKDNAEIVLSEKGINPFIQNCFDYGSVRKACGVLPKESGKYFLLVKKLAAEKKNADDPEHYSLNIALVTDDKDQFRDWLTQEKDSEQDISETIRDSMKIDHINDFGFTVQRDKAVLLTKKSFKSLFVGCAVNKAETTTCVETAYTQTDLKALAKELQLSEPYKEFRKIHNSEKWVAYDKKKRSSSNSDKPTSSTNLINRIKDKWRAHASLIVAGIILFIAIIGIIKIISNINNPNA